MHKAGHAFTINANFEKIIIPIIGTGNIDKLKASSGRYEAVQPGTPPAVSDNEALEPITRSTDIPPDAGQDMSPPPPQPQYAPPPAGPGDAEPQGSTGFLKEFEEGGSIFDQIDDGLGGESPLSAPQTDQTQFPAEPPSQQYSEPPPIPSGTRGG